MKAKTVQKIETFKQYLDIQEITKESNVDSLECALAICDLSDIIQKYHIWKKYMPRVFPYYAVKCNDHPIILKLLATLGTGFDCASKGEIKKVLSIGVSTDRIIFANPTKPRSHIMYGLQKGVKVMTFDNKCELYKIQCSFPDAKLIIRIRCDAKKAQCQLGEKFGCDPILEAPELLVLAKALRLNIVGVSFHVGSGCQENAVYRRAICAAKTLFDYARDLGYDLKILDIGGGFPGDKGTSIKEIAGIVNQALDDYFSDVNVKVMSEPGRYFVASSITLICKIHSLREISQENQINSVMYYINDGVYGSFNSLIYDHQVVVPILATNRNGKLYKSSIWGPTCDALDQICDKIFLPRLDVGDYLIFENMGAYTLPIASKFNGFPLPKYRFYLEEEHQILGDDIVKQ